MNLLSARNLRTAALIDKSREIVGVVLTSDDGDEIADALEAAASDSELGHAVMAELVCRLRGWDDERTGVERVADTFEPSGDIYVVNYHADVEGPQPDFII